MHVRVCECVCIHTRVYLWEKVLYALAPVNNTYQEIQTQGWLRQEVQELEVRLFSEISSKQKAKFSSIDPNSGCGQSTLLRGPAENWFSKGCILLKDLLLFQRTGVPHLPIAPALGDLTPSSGLFMYCIHMCIYNIHIYN